MAKAVASEHRSPTFVERDKYRHPQEVLEFTGIKPTQTVVEISPGGGYWTEILGPYLKDKGTYYTARVARGPWTNWNKKLADNKAHWGKVKVTEFSKDKSKSRRPARPTGHHLRATCTTGWARAPPDEASRRSTRR